jgi:hypothetical protein
MRDSDRPRTAALLWADSLLGFQAPMLRDVRIPTGSGVEGQTGEIGIPHS